MGGEKRLEKKKIRGESKCEDEIGGKKNQEREAVQKGKEKEIHR